MKITSLGYRTDLIFARFNGEVLARGDYVTVRTPSNPTFHWGNFLLFTGPPGAGDFERWRRCFTDEFRTLPDVRHLSFGWDTTAGETGEIAPFLAAGFRLNSGLVLTAQAVRRPPKFNPEAVVRPLREDREWRSALEVQIACREEYSLAGYTVFKTRQMARYRAMTQAKRGEWFGAFLGDRMVADLGVFVEDGVGRFQSVGTHPDFRRRGFCGTLVHAAAQYAFDNLGAHTLVMVADESYHAAGIYESVGFRAAERQTGIGWWRQADS